MSQWVSTPSSNPSQDPSSSRRSKTSLSFILDPVSPPSSNHRSNSTKPYTKRYPPGQSRLETLPQTVLGRIAFHLVIDSKGIGRSPSSLIPFLLTSRAVNSAITFDANPVLYNQLFRATFDYDAMDRRYEWMIKNLAGVAGRGRGIFDLFKDPRSWAIDYKTRWTMARRMKIIVEKDTVDVEGVCDREQLTADLWNVWFLVTEHDNLNFAFLQSECDFSNWLLVHYRDDLLRDSLVPGYPRETGDKALAFWSALSSGSEIAVERTPAQIDEKIFIMRPYVFACAKYDVAFAPWQHRRLPLCETEGEHEPQRSKELPYSRFGHTWKRAPPSFVLGCYLGFLRLLERQPGRMGLKPGSSTFFLTPEEAALPGLFSIPPLLTSISHDREWQRNSVCPDPLTSPGLPALTFKGFLEGFWRGKFLFYDFESYRQILAGNMRGVYTGTFAEQAAEMELTETIIRIPKSEIGGDGPLLYAGFKECGEAEDEEEHARIKAGNGYELAGDEPDQEGWTKEILLTGRCRTSWGWAKVRGRVRSWDGLVILAITYSRNAMGRWLWRGYLQTGGILLGRWRDTFTAESMRGYEGPFGMVRAGETTYPAHFPTRMEDSQGVAASGENNRPNPVHLAQPPDLYTPEQNAKDAEAIFPSTNSLSRARSEDRPSRPKKKKKNADRGGGREPLAGRAARELMARGPPA